ncbi:NAD-dependent epimerase/dehydratase family protein [Nocardioides marmoriginsengisoli]|uniref:NAD-dependent epimerase/dehydratase family protein n=1 Tax=Nocardioides marmoriginsengisoli TaxID=661483 RepID=A0A3N0CFZ3_9ACTN|nr:NAD-dependent epimerase/dehydratase family protein [Nocardioides marmoriginsengisoli]RNL62368.1 NAD-dependent epimerase/dehydratase family protein [Nocardioides marmoriginsengisoli]
MGQGGRVLVTGGTGAFGIATGKWLARAGYDVLAMARREPAHLPRGVRFVAGDIADQESVRKAMQGCDAVVHLAWVLSGTVTEAEAEPINIGGTRNVLDAMQDTGCGRLVFASSVTAYGAHPEHDGRRFTEDEPLDPHRAMIYEWHKAQAERMIAESGAPALRVRPTVVVGRNTYNGPANVYRQPVVPDLGGKVEIQMIHQEDVGRFFAHAVGHTATGAVNLAPADTLTWTEIAARAKRPSLHTPTRPLQSVLGALAKVNGQAESIDALFHLFLHWPVADTARLNGELGFEPAWSSREAIDDQGRTNRGYTFLALKRIRNLTTLDRTTERPAPFVGEQDGAERLPGQLGEFDTRRPDPAYPEWTCSNLAEAFPGPMTPLSLQLASDTILMSAEVVARLLPLDERVKDLVRHQQVGIFGHQLYQNTSVMREMVVSVPGQTPEDFDHQINGRDFPEGWVRPKPSLGDVLGMAKFAAVAGPRLARLDRAVDEIVGRAGELAAESAGLAAMPDAALLNRIEMLWDELIRAWQVGNTCTFMVSAPSGLLERRYGAAALAAVSQGAEELASGATLKGVQDLAVRATGDATVRGLLAGKVTDATWEKVQADAPRFAAAVRALLAQVGHRGPGETELSNPTYADAPHLLLRAVAGVLTTGVRERPSYAAGSPGERRLAAATAKAIGRRERARDAVSLTIDQLRKALREWGDRLVRQEVVQHRDDVCYLTFEELFTVTAGEAGPLVERRRAERARLQALSLPTRFEHAIDLDDAGPEESAGGVLTGAAVSPGVYRGPVRMLVSPDDEIEPGEVLVARATDTGWTPFFGIAGAIVTEIGGMMSHASIVAREFGVPAVVGVDGVMAALRDGQLVEVDGSAGTVTPVED